jgi:hypothetical protein
MATRIISEYLGIEFIQDIKTKIGDSDINKNWTCVSPNTKFLRFDDEYIYFEETYYDKEI